MDNTEICSFENCADDANVFIKQEPFCEYHAADSLLNELEEKDLERLITYELSALNENEIRQLVRKAGWESILKMTDRELSIPFKTTEAELEKLPKIVKAMYAAGLDNVLIERALSAAQSDQGVFNLMFIWHQENLECQRTIKELKSLLESFSK